jgi:hypothetical protein
MHATHGMHTATRRANILGYGSILALCLGFAASCSRSSLEAEIPEAVEDQTSAREGVGDTIVDEVAGVKVRASVDEWDGNEDVFDHVTPVRLEIHNDSGKRLRITYENIELQAADGTTYPALPLYRIGGTVTEPVIVSDWDYTPTYQQGFYVAPYAAPFYDGDYMIYEGHFDYEPGYYDTYYKYWAEVALPTSYMVQKSLPEGALSSQSRMDGWVYFQKIPEREVLEPVYLTMSLVNADNGERIGRVRLPFSID